VPFRDPEDDSLADPLPASPLPLLARWLEEARERRVQPNPAALTVATVDPDGRPSAPDPGGELPPIEREPGPT